MIKAHDRNNPHVQIIVRNGELIMKCLICETIHKQLFPITHAGAIALAATVARIGQDHAHSEVTRNGQS